MVTTPVGVADEGSEVVGRSASTPAGSRTRPVVEAKHCRPIEVEVAVLLGAPVDELTVAAKAC